ncbi:MAG: ABC transporter ATP-binding protein [Myxococcales bacterium]|nr:ABC transporter ATP-binding protein [Myxococcales bacterium]
MTSALAARQLQKSWLSQPVLRGIDIDLAPGTITVLLGANGAGKSTLIRILAGDLLPERGIVKVHGEPIANGASGLAHVAQSPPLAPFLSVLEHAEAMIGWRKLDRTTTLERLHRHAEALEIHRALDRPTRVLSGGMKQKAALCLGLAASTPVLLLDEPHTGLDIRSALALRKLLKAHRDEGCAILVASHLAESALAIADRAVVLSHGRLTLDLDDATLAAFDGDARAFEQAVLEAMDRGDAAGGESEPVRSNL